MKKDLSSATAAVLGSLPGFTLPFVAALVLAPGDSDLLLLALSVGITQAIIVSAAVELTTIAEYGRVLGKRQNPAGDSLRVFRRRVLRFALLLAVIVTPALGAAYAVGSADGGELMVLVSAVAVTPVIAAGGSLLSGECVARGGPVAPIAVHSMRSLLPAVLLLAWPDAPLVLIAAMLPAGEAVRASVLAVAVRRLRARQTGEESRAELVADGLIPQALSSGVTQLGPAVDRLYLSIPGSGYISSYEMSDRLMYAASQFFSMTFIYRRVATWAQLPTMGRDDAKVLLRRDGRTLGVMAVVLSVGGALGCVLALGSGLLPDEWSQGFWWGAIVMLSLPAHLFNVVGTRLLVVARKQNLMLVIAGITAVLNAALDTLLFVLIGPVGIIVATVALRWIMSGVYVLVLRTAVPQAIGQELV